MMGSAIRLWFRCAYRDPWMRMALVGLFLFFFWIAPAWPHDWYRDLKQPGTQTPCCNGDAVTGDCRVITRVERGPSGDWRVDIEGTGIWQLVPPAKVISAAQNPHPFQFHICAVKAWWLKDHWTIHCFIEAVTGG